MVQQNTSKNPEVPWRKIINTADKKRWSHLQKNDGTAKDKHSVGRCYLCDVYDVCFAQVITICTDCFLRKNKAGIMNYTFHENIVWCESCMNWGKPSKYRFNSFRVNVNICMKCMDRIERHGLSAPLSPTYHKHRKKYGKDYEILTGASKAFLQGL